MTNTTALSEFDLLELVSFAAKAEWEGSKRYTYENWTWTFEDPALNERAADFAGFMEIYRENRAALDAWEAAHHTDASDLINAHRDEQDRRRDDACLWAVKRNDGQIFPEPSREHAEYFLNSEYAASHGVTFTLLQRGEPGGEWHAPTIGLDAAMAELGSVVAELNAGAAVMAANIESLEAFVAENQPNADH